MSPRFPSVTRKVLKGASVLHFPTLEKLAVSQI